MKIALCKNCGNPPEVFKGTCISGWFILCAANKECWRSKNNANGDTEEEAIKNWNKEQEE